MVTDENSKRHLPCAFLHVCYVFFYHKVSKKEHLWHRNVPGLQNSAVEMVEWFGKHLQLIFTQPSLKPVQHISYASCIFAQRFRDIKILKS